MRLLIIATYRDTDLTRTHSLTSMLTDLRRESGVERLALHRETEGSPFFITEILRNLNESGAVFREGERWTSGGTRCPLMRWRSRGVPAIASDWRMR